ncbi:MAG: zinc ribbon domain-containing protein [Candidatus Hydrogenedentes bacterium]|nr:zinc ribbon domain-containing protein [Candidatus Hydrogenedentota bacterium]
MSDRKQRPDSEFDRIDADAVCEACGAVNPEDTLFCKSCGNNLRDQRVSRITDGRGAEVLLESTKEPVEWLSKALTLLGILVVIWTAINASNGNIVKWLLATHQTLEAGPGAVDLWSGPDKAAYEDLLKQIDAHPVTAEEIESASAGPQPAQGYDGLYFLKSSTSASAAVIGQAAAKQDDDRVLFVAKLPRGAEVRGISDISPGGLKTTTASVKIGKNVMAASGVAQKAKSGGFLCSGRQGGGEDDDADSPVFSAVAYRIPAS